MRALPYGMRRVKVLALAAGERDLVNRMRGVVWRHFGQGTRSHHGSEGLIDTAGPYPFSSMLSGLRQTLFFDQTSWLPDNLLERGDRMMMAGSIEGRMPFMDVVLAGVVARFPDHFLIGAKGGKAVLRACMEKLLPPKILHRKKVGFRVPFGLWVRGPYCEFAQDMLGSETSQLARICRQAKLQQSTQRAFERLAEPRTDPLVADQSRDLPAGVQAFAARRREGCSQESRVTITTDGLSSTPLRRI